MPANPDIDIQQKALPACPNGTNSKVVRDSTSPIEFDWNPLTSSNLSFDSDLRDNTNRGFTTPPAQPFWEESQERLKRQIPRLNHSKCPHCSESFSRKHARSHIPRCQKRNQHPDTCDNCGKKFLHLKDLTRHQQTSCRSGRPQPRMFACTCGNDFARKDGLQRHIKTVTRNSKNDKHLAVQVDRSN